MAHELKFHHLHPSPLPGSESHDAPGNSAEVWKGSGVERFHTAAEYAVWKGFSLPDRKQGELSQDVRDGIT